MVRTGSVQEVVGRGGSESPAAGGRSCRYQHRINMDIKPQLSPFLFFMPLLAGALCALLILSCKSSSTDSGTPPPGGGSNGLTAHPASVRLLPGVTTVVQISGSTRPDTILTAPNGVIATA